MAQAKSTKEKALGHAMRLLQTRGFNGFSFQHVADAVGVQKPSLYVHFKSKEDLGVCLLEAYVERFQDWTKAVSSLSPDKQIHALFSSFFEFSSRGRGYCPLAALSGDFNGLPTAMRSKLQRAFKIQCAWLKGVIELGQTKKVFNQKLSSEEISQAIYAMALGSQQVGRILGQPKRINSIEKEALRILGFRN